MIKRVDQARGNATLCNGMIGPLTTDRIDDKLVEMFQQSSEMGFGGALLYND